MRASSFLTLALLALVASEAEAQTGYRRTLVPRSTLCVLWNNRDYVYRVDSAGSSRTPGDTEFAAIDASFASWAALSGTCSDFTFTRGPDIQKPRVGYLQGGKENENVVTFREVNCDEVVPKGDPCHEDDTCSNLHACWEHGGATIALTTTTFVFRTGYILDADIELNATDNGRGYLFTTVDSPPCAGELSTDCIAADLQNTLTHEIGHVVGLDHVGVIGSTMEPTAPPGETHKRIIDVGSAAGFCDAYPRGLPPTQCTGSAVATNVQAVGSGPGLPGLGCGAGTGGLLPVGALLGLLALGRRRARPGAARPAPRD